MKLDNQMSKLVALLHNIQAEIHFVSTKMDPAGFMSRVIPKKENKKEEPEARRINHVKLNGQIRRVDKGEDELSEFLTRGKASE